MVPEEKLLVLCGDTSNLSVTYSTPTILDTDNYLYYISLDEFDVYNSIPNIKKSANTLKIKPGKDKPEQTISIEPGSYEVSQIYSAIITELVNKDIKNPDENFKFIPRTATSKLYIELKEGWNLSFDVNNSIAKILGFKRKDKFSGPKVCEPSSIVMINQIDSLIFYCNIVEPSYFNDTQVPLLYVHPIDVPPGYKMLLGAGKEPTFIKVNVNVLDKLRVWVEDKKGELIDFRGEVLTATLRLRRVLKNQ